MFIIIQNRAGALPPLSKLTELMPEQEPANNLFEGLSFESCNPGGWTVANFTLHRKTTQFWADLETFNRVTINEGPVVLWEGYIDKPERSINPDKIDVSCLGWSSRLNELGTVADITAGGGGYKMSTFLTGVVLVDALLELVAGTIATTDYAYPVNTKFEFAPYTNYFDCMTRFNEANNYNWGVWTDRKLNFSVKTPTTINWFAYVNDCADLKISPNPEKFCNLVYVTYQLPSYSHIFSVTRTDATSVTTYGRTVKSTISAGTVTDATTANLIGDTYLLDCSTLRVAAEFTCNRIFDTNGVERDLAEVRAGDNVRLVDWLPTSDLLTGVNDIATFQIKSTKYDHDSHTLSVTPTEFVSQVEVELARNRMVTY